MGIASFTASCNNTAVANYDVYCQMQSMMGGAPKLEREFRYENEN
jgi:hypothetical protein